VVVGWAEGRLTEGTEFAPDALGRALGAALEGRGLGGELGRTLPPCDEPREGDWALGDGREGEGALEGRETLEPPEGRGAGAEELGRGAEEPCEPREGEGDPAWEPFEEPRCAWTKPASPRARMQMPNQDSRRMFMGVRAPWDRADAGQQQMRCPVPTGQERVWKGGAEPLVLSSGHRAGLSGGAGEGPFPRAPWRARARRVGRLRPRAAGLP